MTRLVKNGSADLTLVTKVILGVFGFVPAFDSYFCESCKFSKMDNNSLCHIKKFYESNKKEVDNLSEQIFTINFTTGEKTNIHYPKAKIIDMYGFQLAGEKKTRI